MGFNPNAPRVAPVTVTKRKAGRPVTKRSNPAPAPAPNVASGVVPGVAHVSAAPAPAPSAAGSIRVNAPLMKDTGNYLLYAHIDKGRILSQTHISKTMIEGEASPSVDVTITEHWD